MTVKTKLGKKSEPAISLKKSDDLIAIRTRSTRSINAGPVPSAAAAEVKDGELILEFPEAGVEVYRVKVGKNGKSLESRKQRLRMMPDIRFAGGVMTDEVTGEPVIYTENIFIKFNDEVDPEDCKKIIAEADLTIKKELKYAANAYFTGAPEGIGTKVFDIANKLLERPEVEYCHPELVRRRERRQIFDQQWHLKTTTINGVTVNASANVEAAHRITRGEGTIIALIDDGVEINHPEFSSPGKIVFPRDASLGNDNPMPKFNDDSHGTACAGVATADGNFGASGVAPKAKLMPIRLSSALGSQQEADAFEWAADHGADIISCSWGPADGRWFDPNDPMHNRSFPLPASTKLAIDYATTQGRNGKGCVIFFAAGNGNEKVDNDGYASYERVIAVAACGDRGIKSVYSDFGKAIWCSFPSSDFGFEPTNHPDPLTSGIWTTDRVGARGYNPGDLRLGDSAGLFTNDFGGTSSSCPGAAGVGALVLAVNPTLKWQEVRDVIRKACDKIDPSAGNYDSTGRSPYYGYGRINAEAAVLLARPSISNKVTISKTFNMPLPDLKTVSASFEVGESQKIENISVLVDILHTYIGDLVVTLIPPPPLRVGNIILHNRKGGATNNIKKQYDALSVPGLSKLKGKSVHGRWTLQIQDKAFRDIGTLVSFGLELTFQQPVPRTRRNGSRSPVKKVAKKAMKKKMKA